MKEARASQPRSHKSGQGRTRRPSKAHRKPRGKAMDTPADTNPQRLVPRKGRPGATRSHRKAWAASGEPRRDPQGTPKTPQGPPQNPCGKHMPARRQHVLPTQALSTKEGIMGIPPGTLRAPRRDPRDARRAHPKTPPGAPLGRYQASSRWRPQERHGSRRTPAETARGQAKARKKTKRQTPNPLYINLLNMAGRYQTKSAWNMLTDMQWTPAWSNASHF